MMNASEEIVKELPENLEDFMRVAAQSARPAIRARPVGPAIKGETGEELMKRLPSIHFHELFPKYGAYNRYKYISVFGILPEIGILGDYCQFGVFQGQTARFLTPYVPKGRRFHLFDSFEGLPEGWFGKYSKGAFDLKGVIPDFDLNVCRIHKGWFKDTVPLFLAEHSEQLAFLHMDADLYSSTIDVLFPLNKLIVPGTVLLFDEYVIKGTDDEHRALVDWMHQFGREVEYLWKTKWAQVAVRVIK